MLLRLRRKGDHKDRPYPIKPSTLHLSTVADNLLSSQPASLKMTPMLRQYLEIKEQHPGAILFYRMGDFYEMFFEDAETASRVLGITLTSRSREDDNKVPMCGVPYHAVTGYLGKMVKAGYRVALCEQVEDPKQAKGIVRREVVRVVSPGVTTDEQLLDEKSNTYVCALSASRKGQKLLAIGLSFLDVSTGNFLISELPLSDGRCEQRPRRPTLIGSSLLLR
jgi:DNA mismatch repair protein MutS